MVRALETDCPVVDPSLEWIWRAWHRLTDDRPRYGGGMDQPIPGRIPWTVVHQWGRYQRLARGEMGMLDICIGAMDALYLEWWVSRQKVPDKS